MALLDFECGDRIGAHGLLEQALAGAAARRFRYPFVDNPDVACRELLAAHVSVTAYPDFLDECRSWCEQAAARRNPHRAAGLTPRETEVLAYLRSPMTAEEFATAQCLGEHRQTHQRSIYRKPGTTNRREAIRRA